MQDAPALPATTLANQCYPDMFMNCTSLTTAPDLPAPTLAEGCYSSMFVNCTNLNYVKCLATDISADNCTTNWLANVAATGTFVKAATMNDWTVGLDANDDVSGIPQGWTVEDYSTEPAKIAYAVQTQSNYYYLYFTYRTEELEVGGSFTPEGSSTAETITGLWSGDEVTDYQNGPAWYSGYGWAQKVIKVNIESSFRDVKPKNGRAWFQGMRNIILFNGLDNLDTSEMTDMGFMFSACKCSDLSAIANFNTSKVTNMEWMFQNCTFTSLDLSGWDVSHVTDMKNMFRGCSKVKTLNVAGWNTANVENMAVMFYACNALKSLDLSSWNTSKITSTEAMFYNCNNLSTLTLGSGWDMSHVTSMEDIFYGCEDLGNTLDVSFWNTGNVENMSAMFYGCTGLYSLDVSHWNTAKVTDMSSMFYNCNFLNPLDVSNWDTGNVTDMRAMFSSCYNLGALDVSGWNTSNVGSMNYMFSNCRALSALDVSGWDTGKVGHMDNMFENCSTLGTLDISHWDMSKVVEVYSMFSGCAMLESVDMSVLSTCSAINLNSMFKDCSALTTLNLTNLYTGNVTNMGSMFSGCTQLKEVFVSNLWKTTKVTTDDDMFTGCAAIVGEDGTTYDEANVTKDYAHYNAGGYLRNGGDITFGPQPYVIYDADNTTVYLTYSDQMLAATDTFTPDGTSTPVTINNLWYGEAAITPISYSSVWARYASEATKVVIEPAFSQARPTSTADWFAWMGSLENISGMEYLNTSEVTSMYGMFRGCYALTSIDVSHFDTQNVTDMGWMFYNCREVQSLDMSGWNTANVERMNVMFSDFGAKTLDLSSWNTAKVKTMPQMFSTPSLQAVYIGDGWTTAAVENPYDPVTQLSYQMFAYCTSIIGEDGTTYSEAAAKDQTVAHDGAGGLMRRHHDSYTVTIPSSGIATFSADRNVSIPAGLNAYTCTTYNEGTKTINAPDLSGSVIPFETDVLLTGTAGETYTLTATTGEAEAIENNALVAVTVPTHVAQTAGDYTNFMLSSGSFVKIKDDTADKKMPANKAYLQVLTDQLPTDPNAVIGINWGEGGTTDISTFHTMPSSISDGIYDLSGRKVTAEQLQNGIYIINGKKVYIQKR